jgi:glycosyltransferase involved in cell wall biosynthesis
MKKNFISILITNHNKNKYLKKNLKKCFSQTYSKFEVIIYDDRSFDGSLETIKKFKKINLIKNKKNYFSPPLNQLKGIISAFNKSKGNIICLMDSDDYFGKNKLNLINKYFDQNLQKNILFDIPFSKKKNFLPKIKDHFYSIWPSIIPTSGISLRRKTMKKFIKLCKFKEFPHLEVDSRIMIYAHHYLNEMNLFKKKITYYTVDENGISSKYKKFSKLWWFKRLQAFTYLKYILKKKNKRFIISYDYIITKIVNSLLK